MAKAQSKLTNKQLTLAVQLNHEATLADFCWSNNILLKQQLQLMLNHQGERFIYLWGNNGSGKSHLLQACCQEVSPNQSSIYFPLSLLKEWGPEALEGMEEQDLICLDDIDLIAADSQWEEALFHFYNRIKDREQKLLIISGKLPPAAMPIQLPDLKSRLGWGLVMQVNELSDDDKINTLKQHAQKRGFEFPASVGRYLMKRCSRNMHDLHQLLNYLDEASLAAKRKITIPFVKSTLAL